MDSKIIIFILSFFIQHTVLAQNENISKYTDSSEVLIKKFATEIYYVTQLGIADSSVLKTNVNVSIDSYFQNSNYSFEAIEIIANFATKEAKINYFSDELGKCHCYVSSLDFFISDSLNEKVKSLRKFLH